MAFPAAMVAAFESRVACFAAALALGPHIYLPAKSFNAALTPFPEMISRSERGRRAGHYTGCKAEPGHGASAYTLTRLSLLADVVRNGIIRVPNPVVLAGSRPRALACGAKAWCLLIHADSSRSLPLSHSPPRRGILRVFQPRVASREVSIL